MPAALSAHEPALCAGEPVLRAERLSLTYPSTRAGMLPLELFQDLSLEVAAGEMVAVVGASGTGKSSLLHLLAALDRPTAGEIWLHEEPVTRFSSAAAAQLRNRHIGYVWQFHYLLPEFTALENVALPLLARGLRRGDVLPEAARWLDRVGLGDRASHRPGELSGGEQQRVALARALVTQPRVLLADEPTGDLDAATAERVFSLLQLLTEEHLLATVLVTHNEGFAARCNRALRLQGGRLLRI